MGNLKCHCGERSDEAVRLKEAPQSHKSVVNKGLAMLLEPVLNRKKRLLRLRLAMTRSEGVAHNDKKRVLHSLIKGECIL